MAIAQPQSTDKLNSPDHAKQHRVIASDPAADDESLTVDGSSDVSVANNLAVGTLTTPYAQTVTVAESGGDYTTVTAALTAIVDASETKRYLVEVAGGEFVENITMKSYVDVAGKGSIWSTKITASVTSNPVVTGHGGCSISNVTLAGATTNAGVYMAIPSAFSCRDILVKDCQYGVHCNNATARVYVDSIAIDATTTTCDASLYSTLGTIHSSNLVTVPSSTITSFVYANGGEVRVWNISPTVGATNGLYANNGGSVHAFSSILPLCTYAMRIGSAGTGSGLYLGMINSIADNTWDLYVESATGVVLAQTVGIRSDNVYHVAGAIVKYVSYDSARVKQSFHLDVDVGTSHMASSLSVGGGSSYTDGKQVITFDGDVTYADVTDDATYAFPNTTEGTIIYIGNTSPSQFYGVEFDLDTQIVLGGGAIVREYWDAGAEAWVEFNVFAHLRGFSDSFNNEPFLAPQDSGLSIQFDHNIHTGVTENNAAATGWATTAVDGNTAYWFRLRIVTGITTSMVVSNWRLNPSSTLFRDNGTQAFYGDARAIKAYVFPLGEVTGTASNQEIDVSTNITMLLVENEFVNGQTDAMYARFVIPEDLDTSCGITFKDLISTDVVPSGADETAILHLTYAKVKEGEPLGDASATEYTQAHTITFKDGDASWKAQTVSFNKRIDVSDLVPGDSVFFKIERLNTEVGDDLAGNIAVTSSWLEYRQWQNGSNYST